MLPSLLGICSKNLHIKYPYAKITIFCLNNKNSNVSAADAILDRVVNTASRFTLKGDSLRKKTLTLPHQNRNSILRLFHFTLKAFIIDLKRTLIQNQGH